MSTKNQARNRTAGSDASSGNSAATVRRQENPAEDFKALADNVCTALESYGRKHPGAMATGIFFLGFYIGWKVKPW